MKIDLINAYLDSITSRCNDARRIASRCSTEIETDDAFADLLKDADDVVDSMVQYAEENFGRCPSCHEIYDGDGKKLCKTCADEAAREQM